MIKEILTEKLNNVEEVESESEKSTEVESEKNDDWLNKSYEITPLYGRFKIKN